jgi:hypothetical protein
VGLTSRAREFSALFNLADSPPLLRGRSTRCLFSPVHRGVLRVLVLFRFDPILFWVFVAAGLRTVRASVADDPEPARTVHLVFADGPFSRVGSGGSVGFNGQSVASGRMVRVVLADCPRHLAGLSAWALRTVRPTWLDSPPEPGSFVPWFDSSLLSFVLPRVLQGIVPKT